MESVCDQLYRQEATLSKDTDMKTQNKEDDVIWADNHPLPYPRWTATRHTLNFNALSDYEEFLRKVESESCQQLHRYTYNSIGGFLRLYESWKEVEGALTFDEFFRSYEPPITPDHYTCVGLMKSLYDGLIATMAHEYPSLPQVLYDVSCEEKIWCIEKYMQESPPCKNTSEKEHVMLAIKFRIEDREGVMLLDPGYHIPMPITCMIDRLYPHTGTWLQKDGTSTVTEYSYELNQSNQYIIWSVKIVKPGQEPKEHKSLIYIDRRYLGKVSVSERRNLVFPLKSWVKRDAKGQKPAGIYFGMPDTLENIHVAAFYLKEKERIVKKININDDWTPEWTAFLLHCGKLMEVDITQLLYTVHRLCCYLKDRKFLQEIKKINDHIYEMSVDN